MSQTRRAAVKSFSLSRSAKLKHHKDGARLLVTVMEGPELKERRGERRGLRRPEERGWDFQDVRQYHRRSTVRGEFEVDHT